MRHGIGGFDSKHARIVEIFVRDFPASATYAAEQTLKPEEIPPRILLRQCDEKRAITASEIDLNRRAARKDRFEIEDLEIVSRHVLGRESWTACTFDYIRICRNVEPVICHSERSRGISHYYSKRCLDFARHDSSEFAFNTLLHPNNHRWEIILEQSCPITV